MRILLFGKNGQVGWELARSLLPLGNIVALGRKDADLSEPENIRTLVREIKPDIILNAAAYTAVDKAEDEKAMAMAINGVAPGVLAEEAKSLNALLVHYSTDYVFDGSSAKPYIETDRPDPVNEYGRTKLVGEKSIQASGCNHMIFRTSWVYASRGHNFLLTILKLAKEREEISVVSDQLGSPTSARLIAESTSFCLWKAINEIRSDEFVSDIYHLTAAGNTSWHGFANEIVKLANENSGKLSKLQTVKAIPTIEYPTPARRPMNSQLGCKKLEEAFSIEMPDWKSALKLCIEEIE